MKIESNIRSVITRLERLQKGLPQAMADAIHPTKGSEQGNWSALLKKAATKTLKALASSERNILRREELLHLVDQFVETFTGEMMGNGSRFALSTPNSSKATMLPGTVDVVSAMGESPDQRKVSPYRAVGKKTQDRLVEHEANVQRVRQAILDWVVFEKTRKPDRDFDKDGNPLSNEKIAERIEEIMGIGLPADKWSSVMQEKAQAIAKHIQEFVDNESGQMDRVRQVEAHLGQNAGETTQQRGLDEATVRQWLAAVLVVWQTVIKDRLPSRIRNEIAKLHQKIATELPL